LGKDFEFWNRQWKDHGSCSGMKIFDFFRLALDIYGRNDLKAILDDAGILRGVNYKSNYIISVISRSVGVKPQLVCSNNIKIHLIEIRFCLNKSNIPSYINCARQSCPPDIRLL